MKIALLVVAVLVASGCTGRAVGEPVFGSAAGTPRAAVSATPGAGTAAGTAPANATAVPPVAEAPGSPAAAPIPTRSPSPPPPGAKERCDSLTQELLARGPFRVELSPAAPRGGERVRITGAGLPSGTYGWSVSIPNTDAVSFGAEEMVVGGDGQLTGTVIMPERDDRETCYLVRVGGFVAAPFVSRGNAVAPGRCEALPDTRNPEVAPLTISQTNPAPGEAVIVEGQLTRVVSSEYLNPIWWARVLFATAPPPARFEGTALPRDAVSTTGAVRFTFTPPVRPEWSGLCVEMYVVDAPTGNVGSVQFNYP